MNGLKLHRQQQSDGIKAAHVFINERGQPFGRMGNARMIDGRAGPARARWRPGNGYAAASWAMPRSRTPCASRLALISSPERRPGPRAADIRRGHALGRTRRLTG